MEPQPTAATRAIKVMIADEIRMRIESGALKAGDPIPSIDQLTREWGCSPASARAALGLLREQGLITGGRGTPLKVRIKPRQALRSSERHQVEKDMALKPESERARLGTSEIETGVSIDHLKFRCSYDEIPADKEFANLFKITIGAELLRRTYETVDPKTGTRCAWSVSHIPLILIRSNSQLLDSSNEPWPGGTQHQLFTVGIEIASIVDEVTGLMPTTVDRQQWGLDAGVPLLRVRRISIDNTDRVVEVSDATFPADRTKLVFTTPLNAW